MISARNQFKGKIKSVKLGTVMAEVVVDTGAVEIVSIISRASAEAMKLKIGDTVTAIVKSTEVSFCSWPPSPRRLPLRTRRSTPPRPA